MSTVCGVVCVLGCNRFAQLWLQLFVCRVAKVGQVAEQGPRNPATLACPGHVTAVSRSLALRLVGWFGWVRHCTKEESLVCWSLMLLCAPYNMFDFWPVMCHLPIILTRLTKFTFSSGVFSSLLHDSSSPVMHHSSTSQANRAFIIPFF